MSRLTFFILVVFVLIALSLCGCGSNGTPTSPATSSNEVYILARTVFWSDKLGAGVVGEITDKRETYGCGDDPNCQDFGWLVGNTAFYYRPLVNAYEESVLNDVAAHEVCHTKSRSHDLTHWCCILKLEGYATYPPPITVGGAWPTCS